MLHSLRRLARARLLRQRGFTLIELMIAVAIVGILAAIAYPAYNQQIRKSRRIDAKTAVLEMAGRQEKFFATNNAYSISGTALNYGSAFPLNVYSGSSIFYTITAVQTSTLDYTITATPKGDQVNDACYAFSLNNLGVQSNTKADGSANATTGCW